MGDTVTIKQEIQRAMKEAGVRISSEILSKCAAIAANYGISPSHMLSMWEVHSLNTGAADLNTHTFQSFRTNLVKEAEKSMKSPSRTSGAVISRPILGKRSSADAPGENESPPRTKSKKDQSPDSTLITPPKKDMKSSLTTKENASTPSEEMKKLYNSRKNAGQIMVSFNPQNLDPLSTDRKGANVTILTDPCSSNVSDIYRHLSHQPKQRADVLDDQLNQFQTQMVKEYSIPSNISNNMEDEESKQEECASKLSPLEATGLPRQSSQTNIGRICNEVHDGKLNSTTILLEGSKNVSNGARIELDVHHFKSDTNDEKSSLSYSFFPGQLVAVEGVNPTGRKMVVSNIIDGLPPQSQDLDETLLKEANTSEALKIWSVTGPYTTNQNLEYSPFADMLGMIEKERPDVVILMGPFVDMNHPAIKGGEGVTLDFGDDNDETASETKHVSFEAFFAAKISRELEYLYDDCPDLETQFVLVPSLQDAISDPVYPQPPLQDFSANGGKILPLFTETEELRFGTLGLDNIEKGNNSKMKDSSSRRIHLASNPSTIAVNGVTIGLTSTDALLHLSTEEINANLPMGSRLAKLSEHFLRQRSYYPLFPTPSNTNMDVNLDLSKQQHFQIPCKLDLLVLPSKIACFAKDIVGGTVAVNPGHLVRGAAGGTYASIEIHPAKQNEQNSAQPLSHRMNVEIKRI